MTLKIYVFKVMLRYLYEYACEKSQSILRKGGNTGNEQKLTFELLKNIVIWF